MFGHWNFWFSSTLNVLHTSTNKPIDYIMAMISWTDRAPNRGRYGNFSEDGPRGGERGGGGGFERNQREGSFGNQREGNDR